MTIDLRELRKHLLLRRLKFWDYLINFSQITTNTAEYTTATVCIIIYEYNYKYILKALKFRKKSRTCKMSSHYIINYDHFLRN